MRIFHYLCQLTMRLLEYQGKELFRQYQIPTPKSYVAYSLNDAKKLSSKLEYPFMIKSQVAVGGRGKAGAIVKCNSAEELDIKFVELMQKKIKGEISQAILLEEAVDIKKEIYISLFLNRGKRCYSLICSTQGGVDIEDLGDNNKVIIDVPVNGMSYHIAAEAADKLHIVGDNIVAKSFMDFVMNLSKLVLEKEAELGEINPAVVLENGSLLALDAKLIIDDNALFRHPELKKYESISQPEAQAKKSGFSFVELDGDIAIIGNGAGLVMSTLDMVYDKGGKPGCFLDFGGSATSETIYESLKVISKIKRIKSILINLFGGIVKTTLVAEGIINAYKDNIIEIPVFARITGAEAEKAKEMLKNSKAKMYDSVEESIESLLSASFSRIKDK
ncbi:MAG TPA: succinate--CoA ligase subunit beta [Nitrososphaeraceae archaeon]